MSKKKEETTLIKLDGTLIKKDGSSYKSDFFKFLQLSPDDYSDITYTVEEAHKIRGHLLHMSTGASSAVPMSCGGEAKCPVADRCPFVRATRERRKEDPTAASLIPHGRACPVETNLLNEWTALYVEEYQVLDNAFTEIQLCRELAEVELLLWRINNNIALNPSETQMIQQDVVGIDKEGNVITKRGVSSLFEIKERLQNRKAKLIRLMVGDRQEKYKREAALKIKDTKDPSSRTAELKQKLIKLLAEAHILDIKIKDKEEKGIVKDLEDIVGESEIMSEKVGGVKKNSPSDTPIQLMTPESLINSPKNQFNKEKEKDSSLEEELEENEPEDETPPDHYFE